MTTVLILLSLLGVIALSMWLVVKYFTKDMPIGFFNDGNEDDNTNN